MLHLSSIHTLMSFSFVFCSDAPGTTSHCKAWQPTTLLTFKSHKSQTLQWHSHHTASIESLQATLNQAMHMCAFMHEGNSSYRHTAQLAARRPCWARV